MTRYLHNLTLRATDHAGILLPRLPTHFEPHSYAFGQVQPGAEFSERDVERHTGDYKTELDVGSMVHDSPSDLPTNSGQRSHHLRKPSAPTIEQAIEPIDHQFPTTQSNTADLEQSKRLKSDHESPAHKTNLTASFQANPRQSEDEKPITSPIIAKTTLSTSPIESPSAPDDIAAEQWSMQAVENTQQALHASTLGIKVLGQRREKTSQRSGGDRGLPLSGDLETKAALFPDSTGFSANNLISDSVSQVSRPAANWERPIEPSIAETSDATRNNGDSQSASEAIRSQLNAAPIAPMPLMLQPLVPRLPQSLLRSDHDSETQPTVQVTIGRIEIKAVSSDPPKPKRPRSEKTVMGLDEYLRQRGAGGES